MSSEKNINNKPAALDHLCKETPKVVNALSNLAEFSFQDTVLNVKVKALITLVLAINSQQEDCISYHVKNAISQNVKLDEVKELVALCAYMGGGPAMMMAEKALRIYENLTTESN